MNAKEATMTEQACEQVPGTASVVQRVGMVAMSADGACMVVSDGTAVRLAGGRALMDATAVIATAVLEHAVWLVTRDAGGHTLHRFDHAGTPVAPPTALGDLGADVTLVVNRSGSRIALIEGERGVLVREREGELVLEPLGERQRDRRVLVGTRGVAERRGPMLKLRSGALPPLIVPDDLKGSAIGTAAVVLEGTTLLLELVRPDGATAIVYDLRRGELRTR
ncbi:MAG: hypothetical protein H0T79_11995, partial [Deltaproteobacteria bacterium]|nr:hypothetical protein [Deltaproteobacteria bacterium]